MNNEDLTRHLASEKEALNNCEKEPIHDIGYIHPFGFLLAKDLSTNLIVSASQNSAEWFEKPINKILGSKLSDLFPREVVHNCNNAISHSTISAQREYVGKIRSGKKICEIYVHLKQGQFIIELQPTRNERSSNLSLLDKVYRIISRIQNTTTQQELLEQAVDELRALSGFHRVKAYRFLSDGAGEITAESVEPQCDSFLGLRFPAVDIPQSARQLYETTPIRIIPSVTAEQVPILSLNNNKEPLDLSLAIYRGHVPVHSIYLQNMGVQATLSLPITVNGRMWGLFAFHHMDERMLDSEKLAMLEILGGSISMILNSIINQHRILNLEECTRVAASLFVPDDSALGFTAYWDTASSELATLINCDGLALVSEERYDTYGHCLSEATVRKLHTYLDSIAEKNNNKPIAIDAIESKFPELDYGDIAGLLAIPSPAMSYRYLIYFRKDASKVVRWAGNPSKDIYKSEDGFRLNPRASFTEYQNSKQKQSDPFSVEDLIIAESLKDSISRMMSTISIQTQHRERLGLVIRELNHRVRNMLALVGSIITQSRDSSHNIEDFIHALELRLQALSETQKLLTEYDWKKVSIRHLFERALLPFNNFLGTRLSLVGEDISLPPNLSSLLALIMNELASNALKYGALSDAFGKILISWQYKENTLSISWIESEGPSVTKPTRHGFGTTLIREALVYEFSAACELSFPEKGVEAHFSIPVSEGQIQTDKTSQPILLKPLIPKSFVALVLEDDYIIAKEMASSLDSLGATKVDTVPSIDSALKCISKTDYDIGFLDVNIRGEFSGEVAQLLTEKGVPFAFATGYGSKDQELIKTPCIAVLSKPVSKSKLLEILKLANLDSKTE